MRLTGKIALVTGAGQGMGRAIARCFAQEGATVVALDLNLEAAQESLAGLEGQSIARSLDVGDSAAVAAASDEVVATFGRVDVLVNNAGILRDKSFAKMEMDDFRLVVEVHLMGAAHCCKAVWPHMLAQQYGRIVMTTSSTGLYGNFGQSNYGAAKLALVGRMQTLASEGEKHHIHVNALAPTAATRMTEGLLPPEVMDGIKPEAVVPAMLVAVSEQAPSRVIFAAGAGTYEAAPITLTQGVHLGLTPDTPERLLAALAQVADRAGETVPMSGAEQGTNEVKQALATRR